MTGYGCSLKPFDRDTKSLACLVECVDSRMYFPKSLRHGVCMTHDSGRMGGVCDPKFLDTSRTLVKICFVPPRERAGKTNCIIPSKASRADDGGPIERAAV